MNLFINDINYELLETAENVMGEEIINEGLHFCREMIECKFWGNGFDHIFFDGVFTYESMEINAIASHEAGTYCIAISYGFFIRAYQWFELWKRSPKINEIFSFENELAKETFFSNCYKWGIMFVLSHEMCHILNGHCLLEKNGNKINETQQMLDVSNNIFSQALEYDADFSASRICMGKIINFTCDNLPLITSIRNYLFALYNVFLLFAQADGDNFDKLMIEDFDKSDHPSPSIRITYCIAATLDYLSNHVEPRALAHMYYLVSVDCISFDRILMEHNKLKDCLFTFAFTEKGAEHIKLIHNKCRKIGKALRKFASVQLYDYPIMIDFPIWVSKDGDFLLKK